MGAGSRRRRRRRRSVSVSIFAGFPLRLCLRSHLDWQCYKINTLRAAEGGQKGQRGAWCSRICVVCAPSEGGSLDWISAHCQQQLLWDLATWMAVNVTG